MVLNLFCINVLNVWPLLGNGTDVSVQFLCLGPGDSFGEIALVADLPRTASAVAFSKVTLLELTKPSFQALLEVFTQFFIGDLAN